MAEYTTLEIASMCQKTERTVQRWLATGKLKATHLHGNRYEVAEDDLQPFLPHEVVESISDRLDALERRLDAIEAMLQSVSSHRTPRVARIAYETPTGSTLPPGYVLISDLLKAHGLESQRKAIIAEMERLGYLKKGDWKVNGHHANNALDEAGQAEFLKQFGNG